MSVAYTNNDISKTKLPSAKAKFTGRTLALGEDKYTDGLVSYYQDARIKESFPCDDSFAHLRSVEFGVPDAQDHNFIVPHNIDSVIKCEIKTTSGGFKIKLPTSIWVGGVNVSKIHIIDEVPIDITRFIVEESVWSTLNDGDLTSSDWANKNVKQADSLYYTRGDNKIQVAATFKSSWNITKYVLYETVRMALMRLANANDENDVEASNNFKGEWDVVVMRLVYVASVDGVTKIHSTTNKYEGETLVDQANGAVDLNKLGLNILGLSLKLGNPTLNATHKITTWANRIKTGDLYEYTAFDPSTNEETTTLWVANVVNYTFLSDGRLQGKVSFVQNFNSLALRTQLLREKRFSNISKQLVQKSEEVITDYVYYSSIKNEDIDSEPIHFKAFIPFAVSSFKIKGP